MCRLARVPARLLVSEAVHHSVCMCMACCRYSHKDVVRISPRSALLYRNTKDKME